MLQQLIDDGLKLLQQFALESSTALIAAAVAALRKWLQKKFAVAVVQDVVSSSPTGVPIDVAVARVQQAHWFIRPLWGARKLVEKASIPPPPPTPPKP